MSDRCNFHALGTADILDWRMVTQIEKSIFVSTSLICSKYIVGTVEK